MYNAEHAAQPEAFRNAFSGFWWSVTTTLTIGYGDIVPVTAAGRFLGVVLAFLGVGAVAIPTGIISAGFVEKFTRAENAVKRFHDIGNIGEIRVDADSELCNKTIDELRRSYGMTVYLVVRGELSILADSQLSISPGDILILKTEKLAKSPT